MTAKSNISILDHEGIHAFRPKIETPVEATFVKEIASDSLIPLTSYDFKKFDKLFYNKDDKSIYYLSKRGYCKRTPQTRRDKPGVQHIFAFNTEGKKVYLHIGLLLRRNNKL